MILLRRWWTKKYKRPITSDEWGRYYFEDLVIEFYEDVMEHDEVYAREMRLKYLGVEVAPTGDPLVDMWERQIAQGIDPDLDACEDPRAKEWDRKTAEKAQRHFEETGERFYISEDVMQMEAYGNTMKSMGQDPYEFDYRTHARSSGGIGEDVLARIPPEDFDDFVESAGLLKR